MIYLSNLLQYFYRHAQTLGVVTRKGLTTPLIHQVVYIVFLFVCRCCLHSVAWFSYWFDNLGFITEENTYLRCATSSLPLRENTDVVPATIKEEFLAPLPGKIFNITRFLITDLISSQFTLFAICLSFSSRLHYTGLLIHVRLKVVL